MFIQALRLLEKFGLQDLRAAVADAIELGAVGFDAVLHLVHSRIEQKPPRLDLARHPYVPKVYVQRTSAKSYNALLAEAPS